jgi:hypothetical protein
MIWFRGSCRRPGAGHSTSRNGRRKGTNRSRLEPQPCYQVGGELPNFADGRFHCRDVLAIVIGDRNLRAIRKPVASMPSDQSASSAAPRLPAMPAMGALTRSSATRANEVLPSNPRPVSSRSLSPLIAAAADPQCQRRTRPNAFCTVGLALRCFTYCTHTAPVESY